MIHTLRTYRALRASALAFVVAVAGLLGCGPDPFAPVARDPTLNAAVEIWALTGAPTNFPTVYLVPQRLAVRPDAGASFDLGFDIDADGRLLVLPVTKVVTPLAAPRRIGIIRSNETWNLITSAPRTGWVFDSVMTVNVGQAFIVRVQTQFCALEFSNEVYAKFFVDSIFPAERRIRLTGVVNPNCGFRSFSSGVPTF